MGTKLVERGITRYDIEEQGTYGFMVRISRGGKHVNDFFSDKKYEGKKKALTAARKRYQELNSSLPKPRTTKGIKTGRNRSGVVGVHLAICESIYGEKYSSYCASWKTKAGKRSKLSFSFKKYGKKKAFKLACLARELESQDRAEIEAIYEKKFESKSATKAAKKSKKPSKKAAKKSTKKKVAKSKKVAKKAAKKQKPTKKKAAKKKAAKKKTAKKKTAKKKTAKKKTAKKKTAKKKVTKKRK